MTTQDKPRIFRILSSHVTELHARWMIFCQLFAESEERLALLNKVLPSFFRSVQDSLIDSTILSLSRLTDPAVDNMGNRNLSLEALISECDKKAQDNLTNKLNASLEQLKNTVKNLRDWRCKKIAHTDARIALGSYELPPINRNMIEDSLGLVRKFLNEFEYTLYGTSTLYEHVILKGDGDTVAHVLKQFEDHKQCRRNLLDLNVENKTS